MSTSQSTSNKLHCTHAAFHFPQRRCIICKGVVWQQHISIWHPQNTWCWRTNGRLALGPAPTPKTHAAEYIRVIYYVHTYALQNTITAGTSALMRNQTWEKQSAFGLRWGWWMFGEIICSEMFMCLSFSLVLSWSEQKTKPMNKPKNFVEYAKCVPKINFN